MTARACTSTGVLPAFDSVRRQLIAAERAAGWLAACEEAEQYLVVCRELVDVLAPLLRGNGPVIEVCAGRGELAAALRRRGLELVATDVRPQSVQVIGLSAAEALRRYRPRTVLAVFRPVDALVDEAVLSCPSVRQYVVLQASGNGRPMQGWARQGWSVEPLPQVERWMLTRHDLCLFEPCATLVQKGEAWRLQRRDVPTSDQVHPAAERSWQSGPRPGGRVVTLSD